MANPQIHNTFASLGIHYGDTYIVNEDCLGILEEILTNLVLEDRSLRTYRRAIGFGENIRRDLIPLLIHVKNCSSIENAAKIIDATVKILLNLTIPVECLLSLEQESRTDVGRHTIFELNRLLITSKEAFSDSRSTKAVVDHIKYVVEKDAILNGEQCGSINNCLLLLRNILHIPENRMSISICPLANSSLQHRIIWNLFTQSIDKIMIYLMSCPQKMYWGVTMVQLIALMYKDQHFGTLQKLLSLWFEASLSESSEDNESNTSPQNQGSGESSPNMTSDPTSDSSDTGSGRNRKLSDRNKNNTNDVCNRAAEVVCAAQNRNKTLIGGIKKGESTETDVSTSSGHSQNTDSGISINSENTQSQSSKSSPREKPEPGITTIKSEIKHTMAYNRKSSQSEFSDCGYVTQVENRSESISTSSNDDDQPHQKPTHQKPFQKTRYNNSKNRTPATKLEKKELRRKKLVKRSKTSIINMKGLMHHTPTDEDITNVLKEFTVDFLLKAYGTLVHDLHSYLLTNVHLSIDTSHFFWLVTYFLKFAVQLELDFELINPVLSYDVISYLVFQGVWLHEELEIGWRLPENDIKPTLRRLHLVVTAIKEFLQALETYHKATHLNEEDHNTLTNLKLQICEMEELKDLFLLLLRQYNPNLQSKHYLQDVIVTNHRCLLLLDHVSKTNNFKFNVTEHLKEFATIGIMRQYGILLEKFQENGEFVNNCIFTMMHHTAGDLGNITTLFQPNILKTFSQIWETDYELCDDWSDLIEYVIHCFTSISQNDQQIYSSLIPINSNTNHDDAQNLSTLEMTSQVSIENEWTQEEKLIQLPHTDIMENTENSTENTIIKNYDESVPGIRQNDFLGCLAKNEVVNHRNTIHGDIKVLKEHLIKEKKENLILWLQKSLIEACYAKLITSNMEISNCKKNLVQPVAYYYTLLNLPVPLVPWIFEQSSIIKHQPFVLLLLKFGLILPDNVGKVFIRIPNFWSANHLFNLAKQLGPVDSEKLKLDLYLLLGTEKSRTNNQNTNMAKSNIASNCDYFTTITKQAPSMVRYTLLPNSMEWLPTVLQSKVTSVMDSALNIQYDPNQLSKAVACEEPQMTIAEYSQKMEATKASLQEIIEMDCSALQGLDEVEHNSETASVASDLTRMCVSDEEDRIVKTIYNN